MLVAVVVATSLVAIGIGIQRAIPAAQGVAKTIVTPAATDRTSGVASPDDPRIAFIQPSDVGSVWAMTWAPDGDLWYVADAEEGGLQLVSWHPGDGSSKRWTVPGQNQPVSPETFVSMDNVGHVWVAVAYTVAMFNPSAGAWLEQFDLPLQDAAAVPGALNAGAPLPGTWVNGLATDGNGGVLMTRHNVRSLFTVAAGGIEVFKALPVAPDGLTKIGASVIPFQKGRDGAPQFIGSSPAVPVCHVVTLAAGQNLDFISDNRVDVKSGVALYPSTAAAVGFRSGSPSFIAVAMTGVGELARFSCAGGQFQTFSLGSSTVTSQGGPTLPPRQFQATIQPQAVAIRGDGMLAFSDSQGRVGVIPAP